MSEINPLQFSSASAVTAERARLDRISSAAAEVADAASARGLVRKLADEIAAFERSLEMSADVGMQLVSFGQVTVFRVTALRYAQPNVVIFEGIASDGQAVRLIQHMSQLSFLLTRVPRPNPEEPRRPIGFHVG